LGESVSSKEKSANKDLEFAVYSALTIARENILFPGLPMAQALGLDPRRLRERLARHLDVTLSGKGSNRK